MDSTGLQVEVIVPYIGANSLYHSTLTQRYYPTRSEAEKAEVYVTSVNPGNLFADSPSARILASIKSMGNGYLTLNHLINRDFAKRAEEKAGHWLHDSHCNEIAIYQMQKNGYNPGPYDQNTSITNAVNGYLDAGKAFTLPAAGTVGYAFYYGPNENGVYAWNHQERYEYSPDGVLYIYRTSGQESPERSKPIRDLSFDSLRGPWTGKTQMLFVATDKWNDRSNKDTSNIGLWWASSPLLTPEQIKAEDQGYPVDYGHYNSFETAWNSFKAENGFSATSLMERSNWCGRSIEEQIAYEQKYGTPGGS
jgi:hypothetical protein